MKKIQLPNEKLFKTYAKPLYEKEIYAEHIRTCPGTDIPIIPQPQSCS
jgi:hypothetical protein